MGGMGDQDRVEAVYRSVHPRLWRSLLSYTGDAELASDAEAEAFAQVLRRGDAVDDVAAWVWRSAFRIAVGPAGGEVALQRSPAGGGLDAADRFRRRVLGPVGRPVPATAGLRRAALRRRVHVTRNRRAARDQCGHRAGAAASGPRRAAPHDQGGRACVTTSTPWWRTDSRFSTTCPSRTPGRAFSQSRPRAQPGHWSPVQFTEEVADHDRSRDYGPDRDPAEGPKRVLVAGILAAAAVVAIALVATRDGDDVTPADEPSPTVTVPPAPPPALFGTPVRAASCRGRTSSTRSTEHRRRGSSSPSAPGGQHRRRLGHRQGERRLSSRSADPTACS